MVDGNGTPAPQNQPPAGTGEPAKARPDNVPEKFWDAEKGEVRVDDVLKSYSELERTQGAPKPAPQAQQAPGVQIPEKPAASPEAGVNQILATAGLTGQEVAQQFSREGHLTPDMYQRLQKAGYPSGLVNEYLTAQRSLAEQREKETRVAATQHVGGEEQLQNLLTWASQNLDEADKNWYNAQAADPNGSLRAVDWLVARHKEAVGAGKTAPLVEGGALGGASAGAFTTRGELTSAMGNPKYNPKSPQFDKGFHDEVNRRLAATEDVSALPVA